ncbi:MAG: rRNA maturation RNase YbeY [Candidatus Omnitrophica bacterium]|nr:rRNA maturation RNase YbeY [Candidatus Omnitrophota bacterium]
MNIAIKNLQNKITVSRRILSEIKKVIRKTWKSQGYTNKEAEITVCLANNRRMRRLNLRYLGKDKPTDVLAFDLTAKDKTHTRLIADIIVSAETAAANARRFKTNASYELLLYVVHGLLHILGYDDKGLRQRKIMQAKAARILESCHVHP